jgi:hypothetical protein
MATDKDGALIDFLVEGTDRGHVRWEPTAMQSEFTTSFKGKYNVTLGEADEFFWLKLVDADNRELLMLTSGAFPALRKLFGKVRRDSLDVDAAIDEIIGSAG